MQIILERQNKRITTSNSEIGKKEREREREREREGEREREREQENILHHIRVKNDA